MDIADLIIRTYPWWEMQRVRELSLGESAADKRRCNEWRHTPGLHDHTYRGVTTPNCDTLYSGAWLDLADGPILIQVPSTALPYWSIAVLDLNTDNIALMGSRYSGQQSLVICAQGYQGELPAHLPCVRSKSTVVWVLARYLLGSQQVIEMAESMRREVSLHRVGRQGQLTEVSATAPRVPLIPAIRHDPANFWQVIRSALDEDGGLYTPGLQTLWPSQVKTWAALERPVQQRLLEHFAQVLLKITANNSGNSSTRGQWRFPGPDIGNFADNAVYRAEVALWGLGALPVSEVIYLSALADESDRPFAGSHSYLFRIPPEGIPAESFWSLTMYEVDRFGGMYFTANPLNRFAIGDRSEGLVKNPDGSIDIWISHETPTSTKHYANWLPAPPGSFRLMIRAYGASESFISGQVLPPTVKRNF